MNNEIQNTVITVIAAIVGINPQQVELEYKISGPPLKISNPDITYLAMALRAIVKSSNSGKTLKKRELTKSGITVKQIVELMETKLKP